MNELVINDILGLSQSENRSTDINSLMSEISRENELKISQMTQEEIIAEQQQLAQALGRFVEDITLVYECDSNCLGSLVGTHIPAMV